jgi:hypothetical protein
MTKIELREQSREIGRVHIFQVPFYQCFSVLVFYVSDTAFLVRHPTLSGSWNLRKLLSFFDDRGDIYWIVRVYI